jgi:hypothetical protein
MFFSFLKVLAFRLADKQQWLHHSMSIPTQAAKQFYQPLFSNSLSAILFPQQSYIHRKASCPSSANLLFPVINNVSSSSQGGE